MYLDQSLIADTISEKSMSNESQKVNLKGIMKQTKNIYVSCNFLNKHVTHLEVCHDNCMYGLLTKCSVKMARYWPSSLFACLWTNKESRSINTQKE